MEGALAPALGFDWRPGIPVDAFVALALFGQGDGSSSRDVDADLQDFAHAAGIDNLGAWARAQVGPAVQITRRLATRRATAAALALLYTWDTFFQRTGALGTAEAIDPEDRLTLLRALSCDLEKSPSWRPRFGDQPVVFSGLCDRLFPGVPPATTPMDAAALDEITWQASLLRGLIFCGSPSDLDTLLANLQSRGAPTPATQAAVEDWCSAVDTAGMPALKDRARRQVQAWALDAALPNAAPRSSRPRM